MQELRIVLIVVGVLAIAGLLIHGLWTNKREQSGKFSDKPLSKLANESSTESDVVIPKSSPQEAPALEDDFDVVKVTKKSSKKEPSFSSFDDDIGDPLLDNHHDNSNEDVETIRPSVAVNTDELPTITISSDAYSKHEEEPSSAFIAKEPQAVESVELEPELTGVEPESTPVAAVTEPEEPELEVLVLHVKALPNQIFVGSDLFVSMEQNGLHFGPMDIYHRHADMSGTGKVLFSVANMLKPGTLSHDDPTTFTTEGISFFMTLPSFGDPEQNFKIMLHTAQMIADDLGGHVLDDKRSLMTRDRIDAFKRQIQNFVQRQKQKEISNIV
ncbi:cell division protein ZipA [Vibrio inusitatus NBRC 102082]|uniref:Cell division protein ZipA n=1 Tax=Vibrio inusitatus NBRC 102082 TaxID=1219070 RepID=A0A4Y3HQU7_9VIBR|nr:cell division protein ZipA [Vibrio inusitatus]GEA49407.1 cell division protein ZipA [Vibrio inusitatus NBRC 102082]